MIVAEVAMAGVATTVDGNAARRCGVVVGGIVGLCGGGHFFE